jgi:hypothetical protein
MIGQILWLVYGAVINSPSLIVMSGVTLLMTISMLTLKLKFG